MNISHIVRGSLSLTFSLSAFTFISSELPWHASLEADVHRVDFPGMRHQADVHRDIFRVWYRTYQCRVTPFLATDRIDRRRAVIASPSLVALFSSPLLSPSLSPISRSVPSARLSCVYVFF